MLKINVRVDIRRPSLNIFVFIVIKISRKNAFNKIISKAASSNFTLKLSSMENIISFSKVITSIRRSHRILIGLVGLIKGTFCSRLWNTSKNPEKKIYIFICIHFYIIYYSVYSLALYLLKTWPSLVDYCFFFIFDTYLLLRYLQAPWRKKNFRGNTLITLLLLFSDAVS